MKTCILILVFSMASLVAFAQPADPSTDPDNPIPITGIEILLGAGALLGARRVYKQRKS